MRKLTGVWLVYVDSSRWISVPCWSAFSSSRRDVPSPPDVDFDINPPPLTKPFKGTIVPEVATAPEEHDVLVHPIL